MRQVPQCSRHWEVSRDLPCQPLLVPLPSFVLCLPVFRLVGRVFFTALEIGEEGRKKHPADQAEKRTANRGATTAAERATAGTALFARGGGRPGITAARGGTHRGGTASGGNTHRGGTAARGNTHRGGTAARGNGHRDITRELNAFSQTDHRALFIAFSTCGRNWSLNSERSANHPRGFRGRSTR